MQSRLAAIGVATLAQFLAVGVQAHHPTGGAVPRTFLHGLLSGIGHPIIGFDHLAFVVGIGLLAAIAGHGLLLPGLFVLAMLAGLGIQILGVNIPHVELALALSVVSIGLTLCVSRGARAPWLVGGLFALTGVLHGCAFAETVIGAEPTPIVAYILGLAATQMTIATAAYFLARPSIRSPPMLAPIAVRALGVAIAVVGAAFVVANGAGVTS